MSTDKHGRHTSTFFKLRKFYGVFILPEVNMIGSRVTVDAPRERKQLGAFGKMSGLSSRLFLSFPAPPPLEYFLLPMSPCPSCNSRFPERKRKRMLRRSHFWKAVNKTRNMEHSGISRNMESRVRVRVRKHGHRTRVSRSCNPAYSQVVEKPGTWNIPEHSGTSRNIE